jgi:hypothetical protein
MKWISGQENWASRHEAQQTYSPRTEPTSFRLPFDGRGMADRDSPIIAPGQTRATQTATTQLTHSPRAKGSTT